jgi:glycolate oxidase FAD binding subunit
VSLVSITCPAELSELLRDSPGPFRIQGTDSHSDRRPEAPSTTQRLSLAGLSGIVQYSPADLVVSVRAGTLVSDLQEELKLNVQCLPLNQTEGTIGGGISMGLSAWRDWALGMQIILADGTIAKAGSSAVKNVAGYDIHKFLVGTRGTLAVITEVTLRTAPLTTPQQSHPSPDVKPDVTQLRYMKRAKEVFDPQNKLNPEDFASLLA